jgi:hypothetical protein
MGELYRHALTFFLALSSHFAFVPPSRCVPLLSLQAMVAVGTRPVALGVMLVVFSVSCIVYVYSAKACCMLHVYSKDKMCRYSPVHECH